MVQIAIKIATIPVGPIQDYDSWVDYCSFLSVYLLLAHLHIV